MNLELHTVIKLTRQRIPLKSRLNKSSNTKITIRELLQTLWLGAVLEFNRLQNWKYASQVANKIKQLYLAHIVILAVQKLA